MPALPPGLMRDWSIEATLPSADDVAMLADIAPPGTRVYLTALPNRPADQAVDAARRVRAAGLEPVPHLTARTQTGREAASDAVRRLAGEAGVTMLLVIAGDIDAVSGPYEGALDLIRDVPLSDLGIREIGVSGYPEGHPKIADADIDRALDGKIGCAAEAGLGLHIATQFCFDATAIRGWLERLRARGVSAPVRVGLPGPASAASLLKFAVRCGVKASTTGFGRKLGLARKLLGPVDAGDIVRALDADGLASGALGDVGAHVYAFGGIERTARWAAGQGSR